MRDFNPKSMRIVAMAVAAGLMLAACGTGSSDKDQGSVKLDDSSVGAALDQLLEGTSKAPAADQRTIAKGTNLFVVTAGMNGETSRVPAEGAQEAAKAIGWKVTVLDAQLKLANAAGLIEQALASGADAILTVSIDCEIARQAYAKAAAQHVPVVAVAGFDCDDELVGGTESLFSGEIDFRGLSQAEFYQKFGQAQAELLRALSKGKAQIVETAMPEFVKLRYVQRGFEKGIEGSGVTVDSRFDILSAEVANGQAATKLQATLTTHPNADWITSFSAGGTLGVIKPAIGNNSAGRRILGGDGAVGELELVRSGEVAGLIAVPGSWLGWAAVDTLNSVLTKTPIRDSGIGFTAVTKDRNLPKTAGSPFQATVDFRAAYRSAWAGS